MVSSLIVYEFDFPKDKSPKNLKRPGIFFKFETPFRFKPSYQLNPHRDFSKLRLVISAIGIKV